MSLAALVPVKALEGGKSRLAPELARADAERLSLAMLADVLGALLAVPELDAVAVTTADPRVAEHARALGAEALPDAGSGLNPALDAAAARLAQRGADGVLVVLGDVPGALPDEIAALCRALPPARPAAALAPSGDGGTSALLRAPWDAIPAHFGADSARAHTDAAAEMGVPLVRCALPSLALDLDRVEDLECFLSEGGGGSHTRGLLRTLRGRSGS